VLTADCKGDVVLYAQLVKRADGEYLHFRDIDMKITIGGYHVRLDNLFNGDRFLGKTLTYMLQKLIVALVQPQVTDRAN
jgi:hypothetical protein